MRWTKVLRQASKVTSPSRNLKSLALSVYFKQPDFGMQEYEILSRASAFLLSVDPKDDNPGEGPFGHLEAAQRRREERQFQHEHKYSRAGGPGRRIMDLGWLEFAPREVRPQVHVVSSSHVLAPFLWRDYYPQEWLKHVTSEHCTYSLEVYDPSKPEEALAKLALNKDIFHHPEGRDVALIHFKEENSSLKLLDRLGVDVLHFRDPDKLYQKGEQMFFDGFVVSERNTADSEDFQKEETTSSDTNEDLRVFYPYKEEGNLSFHTNDRFFATTPEPLPEGLCGAPVLDVDGDLCGTVEGIVPVDHKDKRLAGSAAFMPSHVMKAFVDFVERGLLEQMMPKDLFRMVVATKQTNSIGGGLFKKDASGNYTGETTWEEAYGTAVETLKKRFTEEEVDAFLTTIEDERTEVLDIMEKEGGDVDEIVARVRQKTLKLHEKVMDQVRKAMLPHPSETSDREEPSKSTA